VRFHEKNGVVEFNADIVAEYVKVVDEHRNSGAVGHKYREFLLRGAERLTRMNETGKLEWSVPKVGTSFKSGDYYEQLLDEYIAYADLHQNTQGDVIWVARRFFARLVQENHHTLERVTADEIQGFIVYCSGLMTSASIYNVLLYMRKLCTYLYEQKLLSNQYTALLSMKVSRESKMYPAAKQSEIATVLEQIDRSTRTGKRDYAVILLGAVLGVRAVDIKNMKLTDIDWLRGEIRITQSKTGNVNALPLTADVGEAVRDYILHSRPNSTDNNVFIKSYPPFVAFKDAWSVGDIYDRYRKRAGLERKAFDGKGFHSLRRALGKNMTVAGVEVTTTAQTLGDADMDSAKKYIALDSIHLAECALNFTGIAPKGGDAK
jgi:integrase